MLFCLADTLASLSCCTLAHELIRLMQDVRRRARALLWHLNERNTAMTMAAKAQSQQLHEQQRQIVAVEEKRTEAKRQAAAVAAQACLATTIWT